MGREILDEAYHHFALEGRKYEYGRSDLSLNNKVGNRHTDPSRNEKDLDGDGYYGVDCSSLVWRGLKNAGYDVGNEPFDTSKLFTGNKTTAYAEKHFDVVPAAEASKTPGSLQAGDILMFNSSHGRHVGIFKGYDPKGNIEFYGSQVSTGPALTTARGDGSYWNGGDFHIVGALRAKPEFRTHEPVHGGKADIPAAAEPAAARPHANAAATPHKEQPHGHEEYLHEGARGGDVMSLQNELAKLGYPSREAPLHADGRFGAKTDGALRSFQSENGLKPDGIVGPETTKALHKQLALAHPEAAHPEAAKAPARMDNPDHPGYAMYKQALDAVHKLDATHQREPNHLSGQLAGSLAVRAHEEGLQRIDHAVLSEDAKHAYAVQGELNSPLKRVAGVDTAQAVNTPLEKSTTALEQATATQTQNQQQKQHPAPVQTGPGVSV